MKLTILASVLALAASGAFANDPMNATSSDPSATFKSLDTDGNGRISESEARANPELSSGYRSAVSDPTGGMTMEEFNAWHSSQKSGQTTPPSN